MQRLVAVIYYGGTVGNEYYGLISFLKNVLKQLALGVGVEGTCSLIEEHDASATKQGTGNGYALCLSFTESSPTLAADGVDALWQ